MPFGPGELEGLLAALGRGEVEARVLALGETIIHETRFPGVWVVDHRGPGGGRVAMQIEITDCPGLLRTPPEELDGALAGLDAEMPWRGLQ
jgi:hydrogenase-1 operon protein HyaF